MAGVFSKNITVITVSNGGKIMLTGGKITDAELDIVKVLWKNGPMTSNKLFELIETDTEKNRGTQKTLLTRLVRKGAIRREKINERHYMYYPVITEEEYLSKQRQRMIDKVFDGSAKSLLLNLVKEEKITQEDLEEMIKIIKEDEET